jgi:hypothetical protein
VLPTHGFSEFWEKTVNFYFRYIFLNNLLINNRKTNMHLLKNNKYRVTMHLIIGAIWSSVLIWLFCLVAGSDETLTIIRMAYKIYWTVFRVNAWTPHKGEVLWGSISQNSVHRYLWKYRRGQLFASQKCKNVLERQILKFLE